MSNMRKSFLVFCFSCFSVILLGQAPGMIADSATVRLTRQLALYPHEKIHVQTDKPCYLSGERVWFRAHVVDAMDNRPSILSRYVYVELIDPFNELVERVKIRPDSTGVYASYLDLKEELPEGEYTLRAYTRYTRNRGEEALTRKTIRVMDPYSLQVEVVPDFTVRENGLDVSFHFVNRASGDTIVPESVMARLPGEPARIIRSSNETVFNWSFPARQVKDARALLLEIVRDGRRYSRYYPIPHAAGDIDVTFHPEGGYLVPGQVCQVAFKAMNPSGLGEDVSGVLYNSRDEQVTTFASRLMGMGTFSFLPVADETYHAVCETKGGLVKRVELPIPEPGSRVISARHARERVVVSLLEGPTAPGGPVSLLLHNKGIVLYHEPWQPGRGSYSFPTSLLPSGVSSFLLLDEHLDILSERMVFHLNEDDFSWVTASDSSPSHERRELVSLKLRLDNIVDTASHDNMAISVVDASAVPVDTACDLVSTLLLASELKGHVESPARYFSGGQLETAALDALMMTQGWRRYDIPRVLKGEIETPGILPERFQEVSGTTEAMLLSKVEGGSVSLYAMLDTLYSIESTTADKEGRFLFSVEYPEGTKITVQSLTAKGWKSNFLEIDTVTYPDLTLAALPSRGTPVAREKVAVEVGFDTDDYLRQANAEYSRKHGIRGVMLEEVRVTAPAVKPFKESAWYSPVFSSPPMTSEEIKKRKFSNMLTVLLNTPGVALTKGGLTTTRSDKPMLIVVDDVPLPEFDVMNMDVNDVDNLFVIKDYNSIFGDYPGTSGALVIMTTVGSNEKVKPLNIRRFTPLGYRPAAEFYAPRYETPEQVNSPELDLRTTIYWKPDVHFSLEGEAVVEFYAADTPTVYRVVGEGVTGSGKIISFTQEITIEGGIK